MIHSQACVEDSTVADTATVWQFASVIRRSVVGHGTTIGTCAIVDGAIVGERCAIGHAASVHPGTVIGDSVFIGPGVVICNDMWPSTSKDGWTMPNRPAVIIEDGASIGANATVLPGVRIGRGAIAAAGAVVERDVPAGMVLQRNGYISQKPTDWRERRMRHVRDGGRTGANDSTDTNDSDVLLASAR